MGSDDFCDPIWIVGSNHRQTRKTNRKKKTNRDLVYGAKFTVLIQNSLLSGLKYEKFDENYQQK